MDINKKFKAEDLLSDRIPEDQLHLISQSELELAEEMKVVLKNLDTESLTEFEKSLLWEKVRSRSISQKGVGFSRLKIGSLVASLLIVVAVGHWLYERNSSKQKLLNFAAQNINNRGTSDTEAKDSMEQRDKNEVFEEEDNIITTNDFHTLIVGNGHRSAVRLADGSRVWLNSNSKLIYPVSFEGNIREIYLEGEAYFDVFHDEKRPFFVRAKNMDIKVLGTEFYVSSNAAEKSNFAVLISGSIAFSAGSWLNSTERKLFPGEQISYNSEESKVLVSKVKTEEYQLWKAGYMDVSSVSLDVIVQRIAKYYNISISTDGLDLTHETFSGRLDFQRNVKDVLDILCIGTSYVYNSKERRLESIKN